MRFRGPTALKDRVINVVRDMRGDRKKLDTEIERLSAESRQEVARRGKDNFEAQTALIWLPEVLA
jgi:hypothetical protein